MPPHMNVGAVRFERGGGDARKGILCSCGGNTIISSMFLYHFHFQAVTRMPGNMDSIQRYSDTQTRLILTQPAW